MLEKIAKFLVLIPGIPGEVKKFILNWPEKLDLDAIKSLIPERQDLVERILRLAEGSATDDVATFVAENIVSILTSEPEEEVSDEW